MYVDCTGTSSASAVQNMKESLETPRVCIIKIRTFYYTKIAGIICSS